MDQGNRMGMEKAGGARGISGSTLKLIAVVTMLIDHTAATLLLRMLERRPRWAPITSANMDSFYSLYTLLRGIGRMAFPIYCFLLVEGFCYTKSRAKYALRLFIFALVSEIPFDMAFHRSFFSMASGNVFFTLLTGLLVLTGAEWIREKFPSGRPEGGRAAGALRSVLVAIVLLAGCGIAEFALRTDYGACGVLAIFVIYVFKEHRMTGFALAVLVLAFLSDGLEIVALLMLLPLYFYNGKRGLQMKYFFYAFYPVHLLLLSLLCYALGLGI
ncbi:MAG: conjugal transfer protein TraX [Blautia sp.]|nr:conjugal transfer protein TraX [Blautia sp.]